MFEIELPAGASLRMGKLRMEGPQLEGHAASKELAEKIRSHVAKAIGPIAKPDEIRFAEALPKTRSGKIMRRLLKELVSTGTVSGNVTTLEDFSVIETLQARIAAARTP